MHTGMRGTIDVAVALLIQQKIPAGGYAAPAELRCLRRSHCMAMPVQRVV